MSFELNTDELFFRIPTKSWRSLTITNNNILPIAFRIKTTAPKHFRVHPPVGLIEGGGYAEIRVQMVLAGIEQAQLSSIANPRFLVQSVLITPDMVGFDPQAKWSPDDFPYGDVHMQKLKVKVFNADGGRLQFQRNQNVPDVERLDFPEFHVDGIGMESGVQMIGTGTSPPPAYKIPAADVAGVFAGSGGHGVDVKDGHAKGCVLDQGVGTGSEEHGTRPSTGVTKVGSHDRDHHRQGLKKKGCYVDVGVQTDPEPVKPVGSCGKGKEDESLGLISEKSGNLTKSRTSTSVTATSPTSPAVAREQSSLVARLWQKMLCSGAQTNYMT